MPKYTGQSLQVDTLIAGDNIGANGDVIAGGGGSGDFKYAVSTYRYLRVHAYDCKVLTSHPVVYPAPAVETGRPIRVELAGATEDAYFYKHLRLPAGVLLSGVSIVHRSPGVESNRSSLYVRRIDPTADTSWHASFVTHSGDAKVVTNKAIAGLNFDTQLSADPVSASEFQMVELEFKTLWDTTVAGTQYHWFYGFIVKYRFDTSGPLGTTFRERT